MNRYSYLIGTLMFLHAALGMAWDKEVTNSVGMRMGSIPTGEFQMGSPENEKDREEQEVRHEGLEQHPTSPVLGVDSHINNTLGMN